MADVVSHHLFSQQLSGPDQDQGAIMPGIKRGQLLLANALVATLLFSGVGNAQEKPEPFLKELIEIELADGERIKGRLCLPVQPDAAKSPTLVVYVHGTGPGTHLNKRKIGDKTFNYFDYVAQAFCERGVAFFSYDKRGVTMGETPPWFDEIDREKFRKVVPGVESQDIATIVDHLKKDSRLSGSKVALLGWSEGTMIASLAAERHPGKIDVLLLAGYAHDNLFDIIKWQYSGHGSMMNLSPVFDANGDKSISKEEYESDAESVASYRKRVMQDTKFEILDATKDGLLAAEDFAIRTKVMHAMLLGSLAKGNEDWIWNNYFRISVPWLQEHCSLEANKTRLTRLDLPIYVFHGTNDAHVDVAGVRDLEQRFKALNKTNLQAFVFEDQDHDLNFVDWALKGQWPEGWARIMETAASLGDVEK
jgi:pimeloyl-ACP methyl ester carboxylesterase